MEFRYGDYDAVPPPPHRVPFASFPPPPPLLDTYFPSSHAAYEPYDTYFPPSDAAAACEPYDFRYFSSRERLQEYRRWSEEPPLPAGHNLVAPYRPCRDPFLDRDYERERIRDEILREEVNRKFIEEEARRQLIKEEVRWELEMERYYGVRYPNSGYVGTRPTLQLHRPRFSSGCYNNALRGQAPRNRNKGKRCVKNVQHKIMEINEDQLLAKPSNQQKDIQTEDNGNKVENNVSEIPQKIVLVTEEEIRPSPSPNRNNIAKEGDGHKVLMPETQQLAFSQSSKELHKEAEACGSKRKSDSISVPLNPATASGSTDKMGQIKAKKQKSERKMSSCTVCQVTVFNDHDWRCHLNGNRHRDTLKRLKMNKKVSFNVDNKGTPGIGLATVKEEMDDDERNGEQLQTDMGIIKKMQVGHDVHEVVEKYNRLWCEKCWYNCTTTVMMTIHLVSEKHKRNCQKQ